MLLLGGDTNRSCPLTPFMPMPCLTHAGVGLGDFIEFIRIPLQLHYIAEHERKATKYLASDAECNVFGTERHIFGCKRLGEAISPYIFDIHNLCL